MANAVELSCPDAYFKQRLPRFAMAYRPVTVHTISELMAPVVGILRRCVLVPLSVTMPHADVIQHYTVVYNALGALSKHSVNRALHGDAASGAAGYTPEAFLYGLLEVELKHFFTTYLSEDALRDRAATYVSTVEYWNEIRNAKMAFERTFRSFIDPVFVPRNARSHDMSSSNYRPVTAMFVDAFQTHAKKNNDFAAVFIRMFFARFREDRRDPGLAVLLEAIVMSAQSPVQLYTEKIRPQYLQMVEDISRAVVNNAEGKSVSEYVARCAEVFTFEMSAAADLFSAKELRDVAASGVDLQESLTAVRRVMERVMCEDKREVVMTNSETGPFSLFKYTSSQSDIHDNTVLLSHIYNLFNFDDSSMRLMAAELQNAVRQALPAIRAVGPRTRLTEVVATVVEHYTLMLDDMFERTSYDQYRPVFTTAVLEGIRIALHPDPAPLHVDLVAYFDEQIRKIVACVQELRLSGNSSAVVPIHEEQERPTKGLAMANAFKTLFRRISKYSAGKAEGLPKVPPALAADIKSAIGPVVHLVGCVDSQQLFVSEYTAAMADRYFTWRKRSVVAMVAAIERTVLGELEVRLGRSLTDPMRAALGDLEAAVKRVKNSGSSKTSNGTSMLLPLNGFVWPAPSHRSNPVAFELHAALREVVHKSCTDLSTTCATYVAEPVYSLTDVELTLRPTGGATGLPVVVAGDAHQATAVLHLGSHPGGMSVGELKAAVTCRRSADEVLCIPDSFVLAILVSLTAAGVAEESSGRYKLRLPGQQGTGGSATRIILPRRHVATS